MHLNSFFLSEDSGKVVSCQASFLLSESIARSLKKDPNIKGINVGQKEIKITQYTDDTMVLVRDYDSVPRLLKLLEEFKKVSDLQINTSKTEAMSLGTWKAAWRNPSVLSGHMILFSPLECTFLMILNVPRSLIWKIR